ncbi:MAG: hypothetical protein ACR2OV_15935 [Hyphomicrobiaceae bacterium]
MPQNQKTDALPDIDPEDLPDLPGKRMAFVTQIMAGDNLTQAYENAGYSVTGMKRETVWAEASRLRADPKVSAWVSALKRYQFANGLYTQEMHLSELDAAAEECRLGGNMGAMVNAIKAKGQVSGHYISLHEDVGKRNRSPAEMIAEIRAKLGDEAADVLAKSMGVEPLKRKSA